MNRLCFLVLPLMMTAWRKKNALFCTSHWDCPRHQYCHVVFAGAGVCRDPPLKPVWVPIPIPIPAEPEPPYRNFVSKEKLILATVCSLTESA